MEFSAFAARLAWRQKSVNVFPCELCEAVADLCDTCSHCSSSLFLPLSPSFIFSLCTHLVFSLFLSLCRGQHGLHGEQLFEFKQRRQRELTGLAVAGENVRCGCGKSANSRPGATQSVCGATTHLWLRSTHAWRLWCGG